jgi:hypothetical protein
MAWLDNIWLTPVSALRDAGRCLRAPFSTAACDFFWPAVLLLFLIAAAAGLILLVKVLMRDYLAHRRALARWRAEQEIAPPEILEQSKWRGDTAVTDDLSQAELAARIKQQIALQRQQTDGKDRTSG